MIKKRFWSLITYRSCRIIITQITIISHVYSDKKRTKKRHIHSKFHFISWEGGEGGRGGWWNLEGNLDTVTFPLQSKVMKDLCEPYSVVPVSKQHNTSTRNDCTQLKSLSQASELPHNPPNACGRKVGANVCVCGGDGGGGMWNGDGGGQGGAQKGERRGCIKAFPKGIFFFSLTNWKRGIIFKFHFINWEGGGEGGKHLAGNLDIVTFPLQPKAMKDLCEPYSVVPVCRQHNTSTRGDCTELKL